LYKIVDIASNIPLKLDEKLFIENTKNIIKSIFEFLLNNYKNMILFKKKEKILKK